MCNVQPHSHAVFKEVAPYKDSGKLLLQEYDYGEVEPMCPYNCGKYHRGRQKYLARTRELWLPPLMMWTHALGGQDYPYCDKIMSQLPKDLLEVHHYQGWWYKNDDGELRPEALERGGKKVPENLVEIVQDVLRREPLRTMYLASPGDKGISWVKPLVLLTG